jgi:hypothetical protein
MDSNVATIRRFYDALDAGDIPTILTLLAPQIEWQVPTSLPYGGLFHGHEGFQTFLGKLIEQPLEFRRELREVLDVGDRIVVLLRFYAKPKGGMQDFEVPEVHVWTVMNSRITRLEAYPDTAMVLRALQTTRT